MYCIYKITNKINNKSYIGYTDNIERRWYQHQFIANNKPKTHFHRALSKYGVDNFSWEVLYTSDNKRHTLYEMEEYYIKYYNTYALDGNGYNYSYGGDGGGRVVTEEQRKIMSENHKRLGVSPVKNGATEAARLYHTGRPQSKEHIEKRTKNQGKEVEIEGITYKTGREAALALGYRDSTICNWIRKNKSRYNITIPKGSNQYISRDNNE